MTNNESNRAFVLYALGRYDASLAAGERALALAERFAQTVLIARAKQNLGLTYYVLGHYNRALQLFDQARVIWLVDRRYQEVIQIELTATYCLLQLQRFHDVLARCKEVRGLILQHQILPETPFSLLNEARAYGKLSRYGEAIQSLDAARAIIQLENSPWDLAQLDLVEAALHYLRSDYLSSQERAISCVNTFGRLESPLDQAAAHLMVARSAIAQKHYGVAQQHAAEALELIIPLNVTSALFEAFFILGQLAHDWGDTMTAVVHYKEAVLALEKMQATSWWNTGRTSWQTRISKGSTKHWSPFLYRPARLARP